MILGKKIIRYQQIDSTSDEARRLIKTGEGLVVTAERQTGGRGQPGRRWLSPAGNLYLSAVVKPYKNPAQLAPITILAALAVRSTIKQVSKLDAVIKWPNDLRIKGKKVGGILTERTGGCLIIGVGLNVNTLPAALRRRATSLRRETGRRFDLKKLTAALLAALEREYLAYLSEV